MDIHRADEPLSNQSQKKGLNLEWQSPFTKVIKKGNVGAPNGSDFSRGTR